jgi:hypothetical protein
VKQMVEEYENKKGWPNIKTQLDFAVSVF